MNTITRSEFNALDARDRMKIVQERTHTVVNDPPAQPASIPPGAMTRGTFDTLSPAERAATLRRGVRVVDGTHTPGDPAPIGHDVPQGFRLAAGGVGYVRIGDDA